MRKVKSKPKPKIKDGKVKSQVIDDKNVPTKEPEKRYIPKPLYDTNTYIIKKPN